MKNEIICKNRKINNCTDEKKSQWTNTKNSKQSKKNIIFLFALTLKKN